MDAKDTVIQVRSRNISWDDDQIQELLRGQDEISSKSGMRVVVEWLENNRGAWYGGGFLVNKQLWQAKLKEWGIDLIGRQINDRQDIS